MAVVDDELARMAAGAAALAARPAWAHSDADVAATIRGIHAVVSSLTGTMAMLAHEAACRGLPRADGAVSAVSWLRDVLRIAPSEASRLLALGRVLDARPALAEALTGGEVNASQAAAIGKVLADMPADDPRLADKVETVLVEHADRFEPGVLHRLGEQVLAYVNPQLADEKLRERLEREEKHARQRRGLTLSSDGLGGIRLRGVLDVEGAAIVAAAVDPLARPVAGVDGPDLRTAAARRADALVEVCRIALAAGGLPENGGSLPQLNVTVDLAALRSNVAVGQLDTGGLLSPETTRRLACEAQILPVLLDGASVPIDIGRARRTFTGGARQAILLRDGGCGFPDCDRPPRWCQVHHVISWLDDGPTDRDNGVALCGYHHRLIHHGEWKVRIGKDKRPEFIPPPHIDPTQQPRRNLYHPRR